MNAGIQDTELLSQALSDALAQATSDPLAGFARQRRKAVQQGVNRFTGLLTRVLMSRDGRRIRIVFRLASAALRVPPLRRRILRRLAMLD